MRLWFCDRALVLVSEPIHIHQVRVALSPDPSLILISPLKESQKSGSPYYCPRVRFARCIRLRSDDSTRQAGWLQGDLPYQGSCEVL